MVFGFAREDGPKMLNRGSLWKARLKPMPTVELGEVFSTAVLTEDGGSMHWDEPSSLVVPLLPPSPFPKTCCVSSIYWIRHRIDGVQVKSLIYRRESGRECRQKRPIPGKYREISEVTWKRLCAPANSVSSPEFSLSASPNSWLRKRPRLSRLLAVCELSSFRGVLFSNSREVPSSKMHLYLHKDRE